MQSNELRKQHIRSFAKLPLSKRLSWAFGQGYFFARFMDAKARRINIYAKMVKNILELNIWSNIIKVKKWVLSRFVLREW